MASFHELTLPLFSDGPSGQCAAPSPGELVSGLSKYFFSLELSVRSALLLSCFVSSVGSGSDKLTELVSDHIFRHVYRNVSSSVMNCDGKTNHVREDRAAAGPCLDHRLVTGCDYSFNLFNERAIVIPPYSITLYRFFFLRSACQKPSCAFWSSDREPACPTECSDPDGRQVPFLHRLHADDRSGS